MRKTIQTETNGLIRKTYVSPEVVVINLDTDISLQMESAPPTFESYNLQNGLPSNPFHIYSEKI